MSPASTPIWDPILVLHVETPGADGIFCVGHSQSRGNARCRCKIGIPEWEEARHLLTEMSFESPRKAGRYLPKLARHLLCDDWHAYQRDIVVDEWTEMIEPIATAYDEVKKWRKRSEKLEKELADFPWTELNAIKEEMASLSNKYETAKESLSAERKHSQKLKTLLKESEDKNRNLDTELGKEQRAAQAAEHRTKRLTADAADQEKALNAARKDLKKQQNACEKLSCELDQAKAQVATLLDNLKEKQNTLEETMLTLSKSEEIIQNLRSNAESLADELHQAKAQTIALSADLEETKVVLFKSDKTIQTVKLDAQVLANQHVADQNRLQKHINQLEAELEKTFRRIAIRWMLQCLEYFSKVVKKTKIFGAWLFNVFQKR